MLYDAEAVFKIFYDKYKDRYPRMTKKEMKLACETQFQFLKERIMEGTFEPVRLKYLGLFYVSKWRIIYNIRAYNKMFRNGDIDNITFNVHNEKCLNYVKNNPELFEEYTEEFPKVCGYTFQEILDGKHNKSYLYRPENGLINPRRKPERVEFIRKNNIERAERKRKMAAHDDEERPFSDFNN